MMRQAILKALAYFDLFDYPLTLIELWKYLPGLTPCSLEEARQEVLKSRETGAIEELNGFFFLPGRGEIVRVRQQRYLIAERKYRRALRVARWLRRIPGIRLIAVANTLAWSHAAEASDIDFFIITRPGSLWTSRLLGVLPFFWARPRPGRERDTFCFSFWATETALDLQKIACQPSDPYLAYWLASLVPVYDPDGLAEALWEANPWMSQYLPNARPVISSFRRRVTASSRRSPTAVVAPRRLREAAARAAQLLWLPAGLRRLMNVDQRVVVTDELLKFHENDRRQEIFERYQKRCGELGIV
ncbi:hypothetical protein HY628_03095 [Candidatus Uhrbacteria bacterium]|nr:hypothetical protein [Candidatus Uhrbacteria bacterium]